MFIEMSPIREQQQLLHFGPESASEHQWYEDKDRLSAEDLGRPEGPGQGPGYGDAETWGEAVFENSGFIFRIWSELDLSFIMNIQERFKWMFQTKDFPCLQLNEPVSSTS